MDSIFLLKKSESNKNKKDFLKSRLYEMSILTSLFHLSVKIRLNIFNMRIIIGQA